jgi:hypothetical protein
MLKFLAQCVHEDFAHSIYTGLIEMRLSSIIKIFLALSTSCVASNVLAGNWHNYNYGGCNTNSQSNSTECNSPLGENVYNLVDTGVYESTSTASSDVSIGGVNISVSGWADTYGSNDNIVVGANTYKISDRYGYGVTNQDWEYSHNSPDHAIDNMNTVRGNLQDFDFVLFSFSDSVTLQGASFSWAYSQSDTQVSIAALDNISSLTSGSNTWSDIVGDALTSSYNVEKCDTTDEHLKYKSEFAINTSAKYWLVGAYNKVFGDIGGSSNNDAFKLTSIGFSVEGTPTPPTTTAVSEPGTIGLLFASGMLVMWRRKQAAN